MTKYNENDEDFLFGFNPETQNEELDFLNKETRNQDGIYRPRLEDAADPKGVGYKATIRFIRNVLKDGSGTGPAAIRKYVHYADMKDYPDLAGYYDCEKNITPQKQCPLCQTFWKLYKSNNQADVENSKLIKRTTKYYSYVMIIEDEQHPELVGKILVYSYGEKIKGKINAELNGDVGEKCNVFDLVTGKDFRLIIKLVKTPRADGRGTVEMPNYDTSQFLASSPMKIWSEKTQKFVTPPTVEYNGRLAIVDPKWQSKIKEVLTDRPDIVNLDDHAPSKDGWDDVKRSNVDKIIKIVTGGEYSSAETSISDSISRVPSSDTLEDESIDDFLDFDDDLDL